MAIDRRPVGTGRPPASVPSSAAGRVAPVSPRPAGRPAARAALPRPSGPRLPLFRLLLWPAVLTLVVTLVRLLGEYLRWSPQYWSRLPGGGLSPLGITWLVPVFGFYFGWKLHRLGARPWSITQAALQPPAALLLAGGAALLLERLRAAGDMSRLGWSQALILWAAVSLVALVIALSAWPALGFRLFLYGLLARIPVVAVMGVAMAYRWGTHYDALPPKQPHLALLPRWIWLGVVPQLTIWIAFTVCVGGLFGVLGFLAAGLKARWRSA